MSYILSFLFFCCSIVCWLHVRKIIKDKAVKGVSLIPTFVFMATNAFEVWYFAKLGDWWTVAGAFSMLATNLAWTVCVFWYKAKELDEKLLEGFDFAPDLLLAQIHPVARR